MQKFYGTKLLAARAMSRQEYVDYRGWTLPENENADDRGYLVEYLDGGASNDPRHDGYISWSPQDVFDVAYQPIDAMSFSHALTALKTGNKVARAGWNGKGMWVAITPASSFHAKLAKPGHAAAHRGAEIGDDIHGTINLTAHIDMRSADGSMVIGWLASQTDMLADDWMIVD